MSTPNPRYLICDACDGDIQSSDPHHYHRAICQEGDFDLCSSCVNNGALCPGLETHRLVRRSIQDGIPSDVVVKEHPVLCKAREAVATLSRGHPDWTFSMSILSNQLAQDFKGIRRIELLQESIGRAKQVLLGSYLHQSSVPLSFQHEAR
jgi:hypothetical protein